MSEIINKVSKPITVAREEFKQDLLKLCESSGLPPFIVEDILKYFIEQVHIASVEQYRKDKEEYEQALKQTEQNK